MTGIRWMADLHGGWPSSYVAIDTETTGLDPKNDYVIEIGHLWVENGEIKDKTSFMIDWGDAVPGHVLEERMARCRQGMRESGLDYPFTLDLLREEGLPAREVVQFYSNIFEIARSRGIPFAAHNGYRFDDGMFRATSAHFPDLVPMGFGDNDLFDTNAIERAVQVAHEVKARPHPGDTMKSYSIRLLNMRFPYKVKANLQHHCCIKYKLGAVPGFDRAQEHTALYDSWLVHLLMKEYGRQLVALTPKAQQPQQLKSRPQSPAPARLRGQRVS